MKSKKLYENPIIEPVQFPEVDCLQASYQEESGGNVFDFSGWDN